MNESNPEVVTSVRQINNDAEDISLGDVVTGIQVMSSDYHRTGIVQLDVRDIKLPGRKETVNLILELPLTEFSSALTSATYNAQKD